MTGVIAEAGTCVAIFAKAPEPGVVKTRLIPAIGAAAAAALHRALTLRAIEAALAAGVGPVELWCAPDATHPFFLECARPYPVALAAQREGDLGARMYGAFAALLGANRRALLVGSDLPALNAHYLRQADAALMAGAEAVVGPAEDGGYGLIGLSRLAPELFEGIDWGSGRVWRQTRERLDELDWRYRTLPVLWDLDRPEDLARLQTIIPQRPTTP